MIPGLKTCGFHSASSSPVTYVDHGDFAGTSANPSVATISSDGPHTAVVINWDDTSSRTLSSITLDGNAMTILVNKIQGGGPSDDLGVAIAIIAQGASSVDLSATFSATPNNINFTVISLQNLVSMTAIDTDSNGASSGSGSPMTALTGPGAGGIIIAGYTNTVDTAAVTWTNATEIADLDDGSYRASAAIVLGSPAGDIDADGGNSTHAICGVSLR